MSTLKGQALVELSEARIIRHGRISLRGNEHPDGYPRPVAIYLDIVTDIRVELSVLRTVRPRGILSNKILNEKEAEETMDLPRTLSRKAPINS